jgi:hypothetical protein
MNYICIKHSANLSRPNSHGEHAVTADVLLLHGWRISGEHGKEVSQHHWSGLHLLWWDLAQQACDRACRGWLAWRPALSIALPMASGVNFANWLK